MLILAKLGFGFSPLKGMRVLKRLSVLNLIGVQCERFSRWDPKDIYGRYRVSEGPYQGFCRGNVKELPCGWLGFDSRLLVARMFGKQTAERFDKEKALIWVS